MRIEKAKDWRIIAALDRVCFPTSEAPKFDDGTIWLLARDGMQPLGYAGLKVYEPGSAYLNRAGVLPQYRGKGLQKKLVKARLRLAKKLGVETVVTYTMSHNHASSNTLISCGFRLYEPKFPWVGTEEVLYWKRCI